MSARVFDPLAIVGLTGSWDATLDENFERLRALFHDDAMPLFVDLGAGATPDSDPTTNEAGVLYWANDPVTGPALYFSDGAQWVRLGRNSLVTVPDSVAATVATLKTDFNFLLAALRAAGVIVQP